ncbi:MAG: DEAD/DEAH box helicase, partial [Acidobacteriota bacterium]
MFALVAIPAAYPGALAYAIPAALDALVVPGVRVRVRLRGAARIALVVALSAEADCAPEKVLPVEEVLDPEPLVPEHILELVRFAADYYAAPIGSVVRSVIPAPLLRIPPPLVELGPQAVERLQGASEDERRLIERLLVARRITVARLQAEGWDPIRLRHLLNTLESRHALRVIERQPARHAGGTVTAVILADLAPGEREKRVGAAPAQRRVVAYIEELGRPILEGELRTACDCSPGVLGELVAKGVLQRFPQSRPGAGRRWELAPPPAPPVLSDEQQAALEGLLHSIGAGSFRAVLLLGVTGSGKTEVYLRLAAEAIRQRRQALILVPEIALTPALAGQLAARFGERVAILHSALAEGERFAAWERARRGEVDVLAGPRSALWGPLPALGLVVVDEEQDSSYKQEEEPRYHARDLALVLGQRLAIPVVLTSATPSLESLWLVQQGRLELVELRERVAGGALPSVELVDLRAEPPEPGEHGQRFFSRRLRALLATTVE